MKEVDARGLSCPEPLMLTAEALKGETGPVKILVTEPHQKMNVEKFAKSKGKKSTAVEKDGYNKFHYFFSHLYSITTS